MSLLLSKAKQRGIDPSESITLKDNFAKLVIICLAGVGGTLVLQLLLLIAAFQIANKPPPTLVQLEDGQSILVKGINSLDRSDEAIIQFVNQILTLTFTWNGVMPSDKEPGQFVKDPGVEVVEQGRPLGLVTTTAWYATYAFEMNFRSQFLQQLVQLVPKSIFRQKSNVVFVPLRILPPEKLGQGRWKVRVFSNLLFATGLGQPEQIVPYNIDVYVRSVIPHDQGLIGQLSEKSSATNQPLAQKVGQIRQAAMEIEAIVPYNPEELKELK